MKLPNVIPKSNNIKLADIAIYSHLAIHLI